MAAEEAIENNVIRKFNLYKFIANPKPRGITSHLMPCSDTLNPAGVIRGKL